MAGSPPPTSTIRCAYPRTSAPDIYLGDEFRQGLRDLKAAGLDPITRAGHGSKGADTAMEVGRATLRGGNFLVVNAHGALPIDII